MVSDVMRAVIAATAGGPEVLTVVERPIPKPGPEEVLIRVAAAGVNRPDLMQRSGGLSVPPGVTDILGLEVSGIVVGGEARWSGKPVMALVKGGGYADYCIAKAAHCLEVPVGLSLQEAAALPEALFTVWHNLFERGRFLAGETVLIHGGASGIGTAAIQMALAFGGKAIVTVGSAEKVSAVEKLGARAINYRTTDFVEAVTELTGGIGVDVVLDIVGGDYIARNLDVLAQGGRHVSLSFMQGVVVPIDLGIVMRKGLYLTSSTMRPKSDEDKALIATALSKAVMPMISNHRIRPVLWQTFGLSEAARSHEVLEANANIGKVILIPESVENKRFLGASN